MNNFYISHRSFYAPSYSFEHSAACLSVVFSYFLVLFRLPVYNNVIVKRWVNFIEKRLHKHELQLSDYNMGKYFRSNVQISGRNIYFFQFLLINFSRAKAKIVNNTRNKYIWVKILPHIVVG